MLQNDDSDTNLLRTHPRLLHQDLQGPQYQNQVQHLLLMKSSKQIMMLKR